MTFEPSHLLPEETEKNVDDVSATGRSSVVTGRMEIDWPQRGRKKVKRLRQSRGS